MDPLLSSDSIYHVFVHELTKSIHHRLRHSELLGPGDRVGVAVSGGTDSVALLHLLLELRHELGIVLSVVHFNHNLRGAESEADQEFVAGLAHEHGLEFYGGSGDVADLAAQAHSGVEAAARELRYEFFGRLLGADDEVPQGLKPESVAALNGTTEVVPFPRPAERSAESAAPPKGAPQGLKPESLGQRSGAAEAAPLPGTSVQSSSLESTSLEEPIRFLDKIATGHTLDDQAETVLMRLIRGTGVRGLGGIYPRIAVETEDGESSGEIVRPLLGVRRRELEQYLRDLKQPWREDSSNADTQFTRNRLRRLVVPLLEREFNPAVVGNLSELAEIARDEEDYWDGEVSGWLGTVVQWSQPEWTRGLPGFESPPSLVQIQPSAAPDPALLARLEEPGAARMNAWVSRPWLLTEPRAVQRRVLKAVGEEAGVPLEFKHIEEILRFAAEEGPPGKELSLPLGWKLVREAESIVFLTPDLRRQERIPDYEYGLAIPGRIIVPELGGVIEALPVGPGADLAEYNPQQLLRADLLPRQLAVRNWRPGDRFWPAHTKSPRKVKELLQERHLAQPERRLWPVVLSGEEIVWMRGFPIPAKLCADRGQEAILIRETPFDGS